MLLANSLQIREADRIQIEEHHFPGILLMEEAGRLATEKILELYPESHEFLILAGPGNNGGDGLVIARHLFLQKKQVEVILSHSPERYRGDARINYDILHELPIPQHIWSGPGTIESLMDRRGSPVLIDALLGTGISKELRGSVQEIIHFFQDHSYPTVAIDIPSGLDASSGKMLNKPLAATHTLTFQLPKVSNYVYPAAAFGGRIHVLDIGLWPQVIDKLSIQREILDDAFIKEHYKTRSSNTHKGTFGHVLVIGGSNTYAGAIAMTGFAALKSGAGLVSIFCPKSCRSVCNSLSPELMCKTGTNPDILVEQDQESLRALLAKADAVVVGPGMGQAAASQAFLEKLLPEIQVPSIWDADALNLLAKSPPLLEKLPKQSVLTPHPGEMKRLIQSSDLRKELEVKTHRLESAETFSHRYSCTVVLKGAGTIISHPTGKSYVNTSGNPGMATAGSGDILSGIIGTLLGQGYAEDIAASIAVFLHGKAGDIAANIHGQEGLLATDIAKEIRFTV